MADKKKASASAKKKSVKSAAKKSKSPAAAAKVAKGNKAKKKGKKGDTLMCFLTTACVNYRGLPDNCEELTLLRKFRDEVLMKTAAGKRMVREYYRDAPQILRKVARRKDPAPVYDYIFAEVQRTCALLRDREHARAVSVYRQMVLTLKAASGTGFYCEL